MEDVVVDSTVLIYLSKINCLNLLNKLFDRVIIPRSVYEEAVIKGKKEGYDDSKYIDRLCCNVIEIKDLNERLIKRSKNIQNLESLGKGESDGLVIAENMEIRFLSDDHAARKTAKSLGINIGGTIYIGLKALKKDTYTYTEFTEYLDSLIENDYRISISLYKKIKEKAKKINNKK